MLTKFVNNGPLKGQHPFKPSGQGAYTQKNDSQEAVVVDVITNADHPEYSTDGYNVGAVKFRFIKSNVFRDEGSLNWAWPIESNLSEYPLRNEMVAITQVLNRFYYTRKINISNRVTSHPLFGLNEEISPPISNDNLSGHMQKTIANPIVQSDMTDTLGSYFMDKDTIYRLRHDEGDLILEGRSGQSIRFGAAWLSGKTNFRADTKNQSANILLRVGPQSTPSATPFSTVVEDINKDSSSIWVVEDQLIPLRWSTEGSSVHRKSVSDFPDRLVGKQIVINSDRVIINSKKDKILGNSFNGIHWTTNRNFTVDSGQDYISNIVRDANISIGRDSTYSVKNNFTETFGKNNSTTVGNNSVYKVGGYFESSANTRISLISKKVYLGTQSDESQPVPLGEVLAQFLSDFIDIHIQNASSYAITPVGPAFLNPSIIAALTALKKQVSEGAKSDINSKVSFTA